MKSAYAGLDIHMENAGLDIHMENPVLVDPIIL